MKLERADWGSDLCVSYRTCVCEEEERTRVLKLSVVRREACALMQVCN